MKNIIFHTAICASTKLPDFRKGMVISMEYSCEIKDDQILYKIGMFAQMNRVTIKTLRHYDETGLLKPAYIDEFTGYRYYTSDQLPMLHQIISLRQMDFSLEEIRQVQKGVSELTLLQKKKQELLKRIAEETMKLSRVEGYLANPKQQYDYNIITKELPEVIVASCQKVIPSYDSLFEMYPEMGAEMERLCCECAVPDYCFTMYHTKGYQEKDVEAEICQAVTVMKKDSEILKFKKMERVETAVCALHRGAYSELPRVYEALLYFIEENDYVITDYPRESYIDGVWNKESESEWLTEVQFPVKKKK